MNLAVFDIDCLEGTVVKELGIFKEGIVLGYTFLLKANISSKVKHKKFTWNQLE